MRVFADRFLIEDDAAVDLATGEVVRLWTAPALGRREQQRRAQICDRLSGLRHPLLLPPVDYGAAGPVWFEAYPAWPAVRVPPSLMRDLARHVVRFLEANTVTLSGDLSSRVIRPAIDGGSPSTWRPVGIRLQRRRGVDAVGLAIAGGGPPGVTRLCLAGPPGSGLRTARLAIARIARIAGFVAVDRHVAETSAAVRGIATDRHVCVLDWMPACESPAPLVLGRAATRSPRRHLWIRFRRDVDPAGIVMVLEPLGVAVMHHMIYVDEQMGPGREDIAAAAYGSRGRPGDLVEALAFGGQSRRGPLHVHEIRAVYGLEHPPAAPPPPPAERPRTGRRVEGAVVRAQALAQDGRRAAAERVLRRAAVVLERRGQGDQAAEANCLLGELRLEQGDAETARRVFATAREQLTSGHWLARTVIGSGRAALDCGRLLEAEAAFRTAAAADPQGRTTDGASAALLLVETLGWQGRADEAFERYTRLRDAAQPVGLRVRADALAAEIRRRSGDLASAAALGAQAVAGGDRSGEVAAACTAARVACALVQLEIGDAEAADQHSRKALTAARATRLPGLLVLARAARWRVLRVAPASHAIGRWRARILTAAARLPALRAAEVRALVDGVTPELRRFAQESGALALLGRTEAGPAIADLEAVLQRTHEAADEHTALEQVCEHVLRALDAAGVSVHVASGPQPLATAGTPWSGDRDLAERVLNAAPPERGGSPLPAAAAAIRYAGAVDGALVVRWRAGNVCARARVDELLQVAAAASAPVLRAWLDRRVSAGATDDLSSPDARLGPGPAACRLREGIRRAALSPYPVLIEGESGSGKELVARAIHARSARRVRRFCAVNCAALTDDLIDAELFGHTRGAFTGAVSERAGLFEDADGGTLFLDEVTDLSPRAQAKLLRVLQEGEVRRIGESVSRRIDARIVAATNRPIAGEVEAGRFRADLRFRLDVVRVVLPPLRDRPEDVAWLAARFWAEAAARVGTRATLAPELLTALTRCDWPGNVRELQNVIASLAVQAPRHGRLSSASLPAQLAGLVARAPVTFEAARVEFERRFVRAALARAGGHRARAAGQLGLSRQGLAKMIKRLGIGD